MPCYEVNTISVEFDPKNKTLLRKAIESLGWTMREIQSIPQGAIHVDTPSGSITILNKQATGLETQVNKLRVAYSQTLVAKATEWAKSKGWQAQKTSNNKLTLKRGN